jgi:hypothetical protein
MQRARIEEGADWGPKESGRLGPFTPRPNLAQPEGSIAAQRITCT